MQGSKRGSIPFGGAIPLRLERSPGVSVQEGPLFFDNLISPAEVVSRGAFTGDRESSLVPNSAYRSAGFLATCIFRGASRVEGLSKSKIEQLIESGKSQRKPSTANDSR